MERGSRVPAGDLTEDDVQAIVESVRYLTLDTTPAGNAAGRPHKRRGSLLDDRHEKRRKHSDIGDGSSPTVASEVHQFQRSREKTHQQETQMPSSSGQPTESVRGTAILNHYGGRHNVQPRSPSQLDEVKHKIFISHSGAQKDFAEQLCVDLEKRGFACPFFDQRQHSLPKGKDFVPLIKDAARHCHVAVMVLSKEFLCSKWPMIELAEFHGAQGAGNRRLNMLPLFYKLSVEDLDEKAIAERWMPVWRQLAVEDARINVTKWSGAVRALRKANGLVFGQRGVSEVAYRKDIVQSIFKLSPPDLLYGSSRKMVGYNRVCQRVRDHFVRGTSGGPSFLGLYGTSGGGKTTLCKALCDEFCGEYRGRVCHVDLGKASVEDLNATSRRLGRVKLMLERLCDFDRETLERITDVDTGLMFMRVHMKREPVFLAIDNVTNENISWNEAYEYLGVGFHPESRIVITSRSKVNVWDLVPNIRFCVAMPSLSWTEAGELFLRSAAPSKSIFGLTVEERRMVGLCIKECMYYDPDQCEGSLIGDDEVGILLEVHVRNSRWKSFHPMALSALGDFLRRYFSNSGMLGWMGYLKEKKDPLWDVWKLRDGIGGIFGLQFHSLPSSEQLLFLDIAIFTDYIFFVGVFVSDLLCRVHEETKEGMMRRLQDLERCGMITLYWGDKDDLDPFTLPGLGMHHIYRRFVEWHMTNHGVEGLGYGRCVLKSRGFTSTRDNVASDVVRLQMIRLGLAGAQFLTRWRMGELCNLEVLLLFSCPNVRELNFEGLVNLRFLRITRLDDLERVTWSKSGGILDSLVYVFLSNLKLLVHGPDIKGCTSLVRYTIWECPSMTNIDGIECPHLKSLELLGLVGHQLVSLPDVEARHSLEEFRVSARCSVVLRDVWASIGVRLRDLEKPYLRVIKELNMYLRTEWVVNTLSSDEVSFSLEWYNSYKDGVQLTLQDCNGTQYNWCDREGM